MEKINPSQLRKRGIAFMYKKEAGNRKRQLTKELKEQGYYPCVGYNNAYRSPFGVKYQVTVCKKWKKPVSREMKKKEYKKLLRIFKKYFNVDPNDDKEDADTQFSLGWWSAKDERKWGKPENYDKIDYVERSELYIEWKVFYKDIFKGGKVK